jgi:3-phosphoshikimate 1-carboxyvinyltransferase
MPDVTVQPFDRPFHRVFAPPGSKSLSNRALVLAALGAGGSTLRNVLFADDTRVMLDSLAKLGFALTIDEPARVVTIDGQSGRIPATTADCFVGNSGTTVRFLTALCTLGRGMYTLDGVERMRQRPIGPLVTMLKNLGARIEHLANAGYPPVRVLADELPGGFVRFGAESSSQFLSALLMIAPYARHEVRIDLALGQTSWPYVEMTLRLMDAFGLTPEIERDPASGEPRRVIIERGQYRASDYRIEPDASNASYFLALAAMHKGSRIELRGLGSHSLQGDVKFIDVLKRLGANASMSRDALTVEGTGELHGIDADMSAMPDLAQTLGVVALFADGETTMRGLHTLRVKETDRIAALQNELTKLGARVTVDGDDAMTIVPPVMVTPASIDTYDDHRMAMSFALAGTRAAGVLIKDAQCVNKTYPEFFTDLEAVHQPA